MDTVTTDRAGKDYWDAAWSQEEFPAAIEPRTSSLWGYRDRLFHRAFTRILGQRRNVAFLELGCARSAWLPYFSREFGYTVSGLDYSEIGAKQAAERLQREGIAGETRCGDLFTPPPDWVGAFDVVAWFGVAEHFDDTSAAVRAAARYLKPGGILLTEIPNLTGVNGWLQRLLHKPVYDIHVPLTAPALARHHAAAGLDVLRSTYVVPTDFGVIDLAGHPPGWKRVLKEKLLYALRLLSGVIWWLDRRFGPVTPGRITSGFIITAGRKRG